MKKLLLLSGMLLLAFWGFAQTNTGPITNLEASVFDNDTVFLTWDFPDGYDASPLELSWIRADTIEDMAQFGYDSYAGSLFDELDLRQFVGWRIENISFYKISNWTHYVCVFEKKLGESTYELYSQIVPDEAPFGLNTITLEEDLQIEPDTKYWLALRIKYDGQYGYTYPFGYVAWEDPGVDGKSNLWFEHFNSGSWMYPPCSCWIKANLVNVDEKQSNTTLNRDAEALTGYRIYRNDELIKEIPYGFVTYFKDTEYTKEFDVEYCVTAVYGDEESEPVCVTATITSIGETFNDDNLAVLPNPTTGIIRIEGGTVAEVKVYNALGQLVKAVQNTNEINLKDLPKGIYTLRITTEGGTALTRKVVKE